MIGISKSATFKFIMDRVWAKINSWSGRCLSEAEREVLIKFVIQSIPTYVVSTFLLPNTLIKEIEKYVKCILVGTR